MRPDILFKYQELLEGTLGAIAAHLVCSNKTSSKVIRDCSKKLSAISAELRKELLRLERTMVVQNEQPN